jgi:hypothetical protein
MLRIEIHIWFWSLWVDPYLAQDAYVDLAHQLLSYRVQAVCYFSIYQQRKQKKEENERGGKEEADLYAFAVYRVHF